MQALAVNCQRKHLSSTPGNDTMVYIMRQLTELRTGLDKIDTQLVDLLAQRFELTEEVGHLKAERGLPARDPGREQEQMDRIAEKADEAGLDPGIAQRVLRTIIDTVVERHEVIASAED
jgi:chorismate mutase